VNVHAPVPLLHVCVRVVLFVCVWCVVYGVCVHVPVPPLHICVRVSMFVCV